MSVIEAGKLMVVGSQGDDLFTVAELGDQIMVLSKLGNAAYSRQLFPASEITSIEAHLFCGNDIFNASRLTQFGVTVTGGDGIDRIYGASQDDVLMGGLGDDTTVALAGNDIVLDGDGIDTLDGGAGRDVLVGGLRADRVQGGTGEDVLIGGTTQLDGDGASLSKILTEWISVRSYADRVANLQSGVGAGDADGAILNDGTTVLDDGAVDYLLGGDGLDLLFASPGDTNDNSGQ